MTNRSRVTGRSPAAGLALVLLLGAAPAASARKADYIPDEARLPEAKKPEAKPARVKRWFPSLKVALNVALAQSQGVVGVPDGMTFALGLQLNAGLIFRQAGHEWISTLLVNETQTKIPTIDPFIKGTDQFDLSSVYQYRSPRWRWVGFYAGLRLTTALLPGNLVRAADTSLLLTEVDGTSAADAVSAQRPYRLTAPFAPLLFKQFAGAVSVPIARESVRFEAKLGLGAHEVWTQDGLGANDQKDTADVFELQRLQDYVQGGVELVLGVQGLLFKKVLSYAFTAEIMYPFATSVDTSLSGAERFNTEFRFTLGIKLWKWASLNYSLAVLRIPLIQPEWQVTNNLMLSLTASYTR